MPRYKITSLMNNGNSEAPPITLNAESLEELFDIVTYELNGDGYETSPDQIVPMSVGESITIERVS